MPSSLFADLERPSGLEEQRALQLAFELSMLGLTEPLAPTSSGPVSPTGGLTSFGNSVAGLDDARSKKSQNMTECVPVPSSEHVAEIVGRQGCKIKALRAKTNTYIKTPVRGEEPVFVVTGRKEDVAKAKREILSAAEHFSQIRASRKSNLASGLTSGTSTPPGPPANIPGHITIQVRVPYRVVGLVVGPKGATIKRIQHQTHTYIVTPSRDKEPVFEVTGLPESVETARREIEAHIAMRTGNGATINGSGVGGLGSLLNDPTGISDAPELLASLYKSGLGSLFGYLESSQQTQTDTFGSTMSSSTGSSGAFSSSGSCSSSSSSSGRPGNRINDLVSIWNSERDEGLGESPSFESSTTTSSIWSFPGVTLTSRPSPATSVSPTDSLLGSAKRECLVCSDKEVTAALVPCGHNLYCLDCANRVCEGADPVCPACSLPVVQAIRIIS
ncbi:RNA-binding protein MEX3B [Chrysoperla carnea]|uniref:RNA-binding protein MEX3B n=1 Tax=Chrysoperla carnea TaxID=189513 RepID=UPI001D08E5FF|nr:RNA-binding protein MEX3B [Chrysoperla carnea]